MTKIKPQDITAVVVTRGGYDISEVLDSLKGFREVKVFDNSVSPVDWRVFGRYMAMDNTEGVIYTQDDDVIVDAAAIVAAYEPSVIVANWPTHHREINAPLYKGSIGPVGWGAVFDRELVEETMSGWPLNELFLRECDRVFTGMNQTKWIDIPFRHIPRHVSMWGEGRHISDLAEITKRIEAVKSGLPVA